MDASTARWIKDWSYYLRMERRMSPNTVTSYVSDVGAFFEECPSQPSAVDPEDIIECV